MPTVWELQRRMNALTQEMEELRELVDGQESWSHRRRLHALEDDSRAAELAAQALDAFRTAQERERTSRTRAVRDWIAVLAAIAAVVVAVVALHHGGHAVPLPSGR